MNKNYLLLLKNSMKQIPFIDNTFMESNTDFKVLIKFLDQSFSNPVVQTPLRHHHDYSNPKENEDSTLLLMPAWDPGIDIGVKIITVNPNNSKYELPSIQGTYVYLDGHKGFVKAILDARALTVKRTAATSALAASYLAKKDASSLLMIGTGALSINLIKAHASIRPITKVYVWGRDLNKAKALAMECSDESFEIEAVESYENYLSTVDIISCATLSKSPLVFGKQLKPGQHLDLVGAYKKDMREADDEAVLKSSVFLDTYQGGLKESGDIVIPLQKNILKEEDIKADLFELCSKTKKGRQTDDEITFFKSVGHASEDLIGARYYFKKYNESLKQ
jgi:ornithine cyclodeaminase/alanine dehydrogenase-like protein (mu-crystallin family)